MKGKIQMTPENKKLFIIIAIVIVAIVVIVLITKSSKKDEIPMQQTGTNEENVIVIDAPKISESKKYKNIDISDVKITVIDHITYISANATNNTSAKTEDQWVSIDVLDKDGNVITSLPNHISELEAGESRPIEAQILSNGQDKKAYDVRITEYNEPVTK